MRCSLPRIVLVFAGVHFLLGCTSDDRLEEVVGGFVVRDSSGISISEIGPATFQEMYTVSLSTPRVVVGHEDEAVLGRVVDATVFSSGEIAVADAMQTRVLLFSSDGEFHGYIGRHGRGPGEFASIASISSRSDTLLVFDPRLSRISYFGGPEHLYGEVTVQSHGEFADKEYGRPSSEHVFVHWWRADQFPDEAPIGPLPDSLITIVDRIDRQARTRVDSARATRLAYTALTQDEYDQLSRTESREFAVTAVIPVPFEGRVHVDLQPHGVTAGRSGEFELRRFDSTGDLVQIVRAQRPRLAGAKFSPKVLEDWYLLSIHNPTLHQLARSLASQVSVPDSLPHFMDLAGGEDGAIWLATAAGPAQGEAAEWIEWLKLSDEGEPMLNLRVPADLEVVEFGARHVLAIHRDQLGVETVGLYEMPQSQGQ